MHSMQFVSYILFRKVLVRVILFECHKYKCTRQGCNAFDGVELLHLFFFCYFKVT
ncbi:hypothetical protein AMTRI_Chr08g159320 [Amborella trichopoda]